MELKPIAIKGFQNVVRLTTIDLEALPEEAYGRTYGGVARTIEDLFFEINQVNEHIASEIRGESIPWEHSEGWVRAPESFRGKATVLAAFKESTDEILALAESLTEDQLVAPIDKDGKPTSNYQRLMFMNIHMWYHLGQLNFIQTLIGDPVWHWN